MKRSRHRVHILALLLAASLSLAACGGEAGQAASGPTPSPTPTARTVTATLTDFAISLSSTEFTAGTYSFIVKEAGAKPHALSIKGPGVENASSAVIQPGGPDETLAVALQPGTYHLWCPVGQHATKGMDTMITVK